MPTAHRPSPVYAEASPSPWDETYTSICMKAQERHSASSSMSVFPGHVAHHPKSECAMMPCPIGTDFSTCYLFPSDTGVWGVRSNRPSLGTTEDGGRRNPSTVATLCTPSGDVASLPGARRVGGVVRRPARHAGRGRPARRSGGAALPAIGYGSGGARAALAADGKHDVGKVRLPRQVPQRVHPDRAHISD